MTYINFEYIFYKVYTFFADVYQFVANFNYDTDLEDTLNWVKFISAMISLLFLVGVIYAFNKLAKLNKKQLAEYAKVIVEETPQERLIKWEKIQRYVKSENPSDWKVAILEADSLLDDIIKKIGYEGKNFGERLMHITTAQFKNLNNVWFAHKTRNRIAHGGADYEITKDETEKLMDIYKKAFEELEYL